MLHYILIIAVVILLGYLAFRFTTEAFQQPSKQDTFYALLAAAEKGLDKLDIPFFLSTGSCLGYAREKNFIDHDTDVDIGIFAKDYTPEIIDAFAEQGLKLYKIYGTVDSGLKLTFYMPYSSALYKATLDLFLYVPNDDQYCWVSYDDNNKPVARCVKKFDLDTVDFMGMKINLPSPLVDYVEQVYGKNWRFPDDPNISIYYLDNVDTALFPGEF